MVNCVPILVGIYGDFYANIHSLYLHSPRCVIREIFQIKVWVCVSCCFTVHNKVIEK